MTKDKHTPDELVQRIGELLGIATPGPYKTGYNADNDAPTINTCLPPGQEVGMTWTIAYITNATPKSTLEEVKANADLLALAHEMAEWIVRSAPDMAETIERQAAWIERLEERAALIEPTTLQYVVHSRQSGKVRQAMLDIAKIDPAKIVIVEADKRIVALTAQIERLEEAIKANLPYITDLTTVRKLQAALAESEVKE